MVSDRRAARYQHELKVAKEESLQMLLRLKQMMDSKINDAEAASLKDKKKLEELEAQLQEAEDIVRDLREELKEVQAELERVKNNNFQRENKPAIFYEGEIKKENLSYSYQLAKVPSSSKYDFATASDSTRPYLSNECYNKIDCMCTSCIHSRILPSILSRRKKPGLYRNGCTQRIHACERNLLNRELGSSGNSDELKAEKNTTQLRPGVQSKTSKSYVQKRKSTTSSRIKEVTPLFRTDPVSVKENAHICSSPSKIVEPEGQLECAKSSEKETNLAEVSDVKSSDKDGETIEDLIPVKSVAGGSDCEMDTQVVNAPLCNLEISLSDVTEGLQSEPVKERVIKYTYQRNRKRWSFADSDANVSREIEKERGDKPNGDQEWEQPRCHLVADSSGDSRQLAQVARQLISLSGQKWWS